MSVRREGLPLQLVSQFLVTDFRSHLVMCTLKDKNIHFCFIITTVPYFLVKREATKLLSTACANVLDETMDAHENLDLDVYFQQSCRTFINDNI